MRASTTSRLLRARVRVRAAAQAWTWLRRGVAPAACVAFEDAANGIQAAAAAGMIVVGITTNVSAAHLAAAGARFTAADFVSMPPALVAMLPP